MKIFSKHLIIIQCLVRFMLLALLIPSFMMHHYVTFGHFILSADSLAISTVFYSFLVLVSSVCFLGNRRSSIPKQLTDCLYLLAATPIQWFQLELHRGNFVCTTLAISFVSICVRDDFI